MNNLKCDLQLGGRAGESAQDTKPNQNETGNAVSSEKEIRFCKTWRSSGAQSWKTHKGIAAVLAYQSFSFLCKLSTVRPSEKSKCRCTEGRYTVQKNQLEIQNGKRQKVFLIGHQKLTYYEKSERSVLPFLYPKLLKYWVVSQVF